MTAAHVVEERDDWLAVTGDPKGRHFGCKARVGFVDTRNDVAFLEPDRPVPEALDLSPSGVVNDEEPLIVWDCPSWQDPEISLPMRDAKLRRRAAVLSRRWVTSQGTERIGLAGHVEPGMSGGPVVSTSTGLVVGLVTALWRVDPAYVVETWWDVAESQYADSAEEKEQYVESLKAHLSLGLGIAVPSKSLIALLGTWRDSPNRTPHQSR